MTHVVAMAMILLTGVNSVRVVKKRDPGLTTSNISRPNISIVNGRPASECEYPWQVSLSWGGRHSCGGMIITSEWVLTAAHCLGGSFMVTAGQHRLSRNSGNEQVRGTSRIIEHPDYSSNPTNWDFALLKVDRPFSINRCVDKVRVPSRDVNAGTNCWISGWGLTTEGGSAPADILQKTEVQVMSNSDCRRTSYSSNMIKDAMICAQGRNSNNDVTDACTMDSGGPLVCKSGGRWELHGVTSWGRGCARPDYPGIWARVTKARSWINRYI